MRLSCSWCLLLAAALGCSDGAYAEPGDKPDVANRMDAETADAGRADDAGLAQGCAIDSTDPKLPGVSLHVEGDRCRIPFGEGQRFTWSLELKQPIDYTTIDSHGSCGRCGGSSTAESLVSALIGDGVERYCECDGGCCPATTARVATLSEGTTSQVIDWPGREWGGGSDTSEPLGAFFPIGHYKVIVAFDIPGVGSVTAALPIDVVANTGPHSGPADCEVEGHVYPSGATRVEDPRSCNHCSCLDGQLASCTEVACPEPCPDGTAYGTSCLQCGPADGCDVVRSGCLPKCDDNTDCATHGGGQCVGDVCRMICG